LSLGINVDKIPVLVVKITVSVISLIKLYLPFDSTKGFGSVA